MQRIKLLLIIFTTICWIISCNTPYKDWQQAIPQDTPFVFIPKETTSLRDVVNLSESALLDDITSSSSQLLTFTDTTAASNINISGFFLYPGNSIELEPVWITNAPTGYIDVLATRFFKPFTENSYSFNSFVIHKLHINDRILYGVQFNDQLFLSQSSYALEKSVRTYAELDPALDLSQALVDGDFVINTPYLYRWIDQLAQVIHRPSLLNIFNGTSPVITSVNTDSDIENIGYILSGSISIDEGSQSLLTRAISSENRPTVLDEYISSNSAAFSILQLPVEKIIPKSFENLSTLDSILVDDSELYRRVALTLDDQLAFVSFSESGISNTGEYLFLRTLNSTQDLRLQLKDWADSSLVVEQNGSYLIQSQVLGQIIGSELSDFRDFYLSFTDDVVAIAKRRGLAESVSADKRRRRVMFYDNTYAEFRKTLPDEVSGLIWFSSRELLKFLRPYLNTQNHLPAIFSKFDLASMHFTKNGSSVNFEINTLDSEANNQPYEELWVFPLNDSELTGPPILANVAGSSRDELIFATQSGNIYALASDGTQVLQLNTELDVPIGSPIIYDWYGNNQQVILLAAGNKIYAWNQGGTLLPKFPFELPARITAPIKVADVLRNGVPEIIVATEDRRIHILDGRGDNIAGWPQITNAIVTKQPQYYQIDNQWSVWSVSANSLHSWYRNGITRPGYPQFVQAPFSASPIKFNENVIAPTSDGNIFSFGLTTFMDDTLATTAIAITDSILVQNINIAQSEITGLSIRPNTLLRDTTSFFREDVFLTQSLTGSTFIHNTRGALRGVYNMGQPGAQAYTPFVTDINSDNNNEIFALAGFGRLYAWEILTEERLFDLPTSAIKHPFVTDLNGDGLMELIAQTREGVRCWTIRKPAE